VNKTKATFLGLFIWIIITIIFSKSDAASDGYDLIGFPIYFYSLFSGKSTDPTAYGVKVDFIKLIFDLIIAAAFITLLNMILLKIFKPSKTTSSL
jgi:hypothetical protein